MKKHEFSAVIIDDEEHSREMVALLLKQLFPIIDLAGKADGIATGKQLISETLPDLVFLDIQLAEGTAFDMLKELPGVDAEIIFVTAYEQYAIQAIKAAALDYILKPVNKDEFTSAVNKALKKIETDRQARSVSGIVSRLDHKLGVRKVSIPTITGFSLVNVDDIIRCEASDNYTIVYFTNGSKTVVSRSMQEYDTELQPFGFVRIHHKHLINLGQMRSYAKGKGGGHVVMSDQVLLEVSARKRIELIKALS